MKRHIGWLFCCAVVFLLFAGCSSLPGDTVTQISTIDAILAGSYVGQRSCAELLEHGDFGIGTFDGLDGEMIVLDGRVYQVKADGLVYTPPMSITTPFASVVSFNADFSQEINAATDFKALEQAIDKAVPNMNTFCAIRVTGSFSKMKTRSVPAQQKPYPPLTEVTKNQPVFDFENIDGTIVGFRCPAYVKGVSVPGYHLHFISSDFKAGGHVLGFTLERGSVEIDICNRFLLILPEGESDFGQVDLTVDRSGDLQKAER
jgi:acetolactate decarboxylase